MTCTKTRPTTGDRGPRREFSFGLNGPCQNNQAIDAAQAAALDRAVAHATLIGSNRADAAGVTVRGYTIFVLRLRPEAGVDPIRALRRLLKFAMRACGMRCVSCEERSPPSPIACTGWS